MALPHGRDGGLPLQALALALAWCALVLTVSRPCSAQDSAVEPRLAATPLAEGPRLDPRVQALQRAGYDVTDPTLQAALRDPGLRVRRRAYVDFAMAGVAAAIAVPLLVTRPMESVGGGFGVASAVMAGALVLEGGLFLRASRAVASGGSHWSLGGRGVMRFNLAVSALALAMSVVLVSLPGDPAARGCGAAVLLYSSWALADSVTSLVKDRRKRVTWMARAPTTLRF